MIPVPRLVYDTLRVTFGPWGTIGLVAVSIPLKNAYRKD